MLDEIGFFIFLWCILMSIFVLFISLNRPTTRKGLRRQVLKNWVKINLEEPNANAIQVIRNQILVNTAFISALIVLTGLMIGLFPLFFENNEEFLWNIIPGFSLGLAQLITLLVTIIFSLFGFINSSRMTANLSYLMTSKPQDVEVEGVSGLALTRDAFRKAQRSWIFGIRGLFYIIAAFTWFVNHIFFIVCTVVITVYLILFHDLTIFEKKLKD